MNLKIYTTLRYFNLDSDQDEIIYPFVFSRNSHLRVQKFFNDKFFIESVGKLAANAFLDSDFVYVDFKIEDKSIKNDETIVDTLVEPYLRKLINSLDNFFLFLWFIKDNSVGIDSMVGYIVNNEMSFMKLVNFESSTNVNGGHKNVSFSRIDLQKALDIMTQYNSIEKSDKKPGDTKDNNILMINAPDSKNRIDRALNFLVSSRNSAFLTQKIALYIPIFECLFSKDNNEISHQVSQRVANYIGVDKENKLEIYDLVKKVYTIRSRYFHGGEIKINNAQKLDYLQKIDTIARSVLTKVIMQDSELFTGNPNHLEEYFKNALF